MAIFVDLGGAGSRGWFIPLLPPHCDSAYEYYKSGSGLVTLPAVSPAVSPGQYALRFCSSVQYPDTSRNSFDGLVELGAGYSVAISTDGRSHFGAVAIELLDPRTGQPCSLGEWRALVPAPDDGGSGPIIEASSSAGKDHLVGAKRTAVASSKVHGVRLSLRMEGKTSFGDAALVRGVPSAFGGSRVTFELV